MEAEIYSNLKERKTKNLIEMLDRDPSLLSFTDHNGVSILLLSFYHGNRELADFILSRRDPLTIYEAVVSGKLNHTERFLRSSPALLNSFSPDGFTPVGFAAYFNRVDVAQYLLKEGADPNIPSNNSFSVAPLHSSVAANSVEITQLLLDHGANPNAKQQNNVTPLHSAAHNGNAAIVKLLMDHHADPKAVTTDGKNAFDMAKELGHELIVALMNSHHK